MPLSLTSFFSSPQSEQVFIVGQVGFEPTIPRISAEAPDHRADPHIRQAATHIRLNACRASLESSSLHDAYAISSRLQLFQMVSGACSIKLLASTGASPSGNSIWALTDLHSHHSLWRRVGCYYPKCPSASSPDRIRTCELVVQSHAPACLRQLRDLSCIPLCTQPT